MKNSKQLLRKLGVYGFDHLELIIIASLVSEDPLLLIGKSGTGKTYLLNSISESLNLNHRHYNASFISFDDLIGFPYPDSEGKAVSFLKTPATIWDAESVLIDELSRCKPETQNKFFSIIQEKKIQGITLDKLKYRWAAMNPLLSENGNSDDFYEGSLSLDQALADRFAFIIDVPDWDQLSNEEQELVIHPAGEGAISETSQELIRIVEHLKTIFNKRIKNPEIETVLYCRIISTLLGNTGYRISPRRARMLARNFTALFLVAKEFGIKINEKSKSRLYKLGLKWSLPHRAWKGNITEHIIDAAHAECMRMTGASDLQERWLSEFLLKHSLTDKIKMLMNSDVKKEIKSLAVLQFLNLDSKTRTGIFAFVTQPYFQEFAVIDDEALNELTSLAIGIMNIDAEITYNQSSLYQHTWSSCIHYLNSLPACDELRIKKAKQFFQFLISSKIPIPAPEFIEKELNDCFIFIKQFIPAIIK